MLVITRRIGEGVSLDGPGRIVVLRHKGRAARLGIDAPDSTTVLREELLRCDTGDCEDVSAVLSLGEKQLAARLLKAVSNGDGLLIVSGRPDFVAECSDAVRTLREAASDDPHATVLAIGVEQPASEKTCQQAAN